MKTCFYLLVVGAFVGFATLLPSIRDAAVAEAPANAPENPAEIFEDSEPPPAPEVEPAIVQPIGKPPAPSKEMLAVTISGPTDGVRGDKAYFSATITGSPEFVSWEVTPAVTGLDVLAEGRGASFAHRHPGVYQIRCTVSGPAGHASSTHDYEILPDPEPPVPPPSATQPAAAPMTQQAMAPPPNAVAWPDAIRLLAGRVASNTRAAEGLIVAGSLRSVANRIKVGTFAGGDPWSEAQRQGREALGAASGPWNRFFSDLAALVGGLRAQGQAVSAQSSILLLESAAEALGKLP
jgi:hypothetical protein